MHTGGNVILTGANTFTGVTTIDGGTVQVGNGGTTGSTSNVINNNGALIFDRSDNVSILSTTGTGSLTKMGLGDLDVGSITSTGTITVEAAQFQERPLAVTAHPLPSSLVKMAP